MQERTVHTWPGGHPPEASGLEDGTARWGRRTKHVPRVVAGDKHKPKATNEQKLRRTVEGLRLGTSKWRWVKGMTIPWRSGRPAPAELETGAKMRCSGCTICASNYAGLLAELALADYLQGKLLVWLFHPSYPMLCTGRSSVLCIAHYSVTKVESWRWKFHKTRRREAALLSKGGLLC